MRALTVKLDNEFEFVYFCRQLALTVSEAKFFSSKPADFLVTRKQGPRLDFGKTVDFYESENATTIVAANALRTHDDVSVSRNADVLDGLFVNGIQMRDKHDGSLAVNENEIALVEQSIGFECFGEAFEELLLKRAEEIFQIVHAGTSWALQL